MLRLDNTRRGRSSLHRPKVSRKDARKQDREEKKRRKAKHFSSLVTDAKRVAPSPRLPSPPPKRTKVTELPRPQSSSSLRPGKTPPKLRARPDSPTLPRSQRDEDEDRYIAFLEEKLGSRKGPKKGAGYAKEIENDGLGGR
jgi:nucleolar MIF4G domain-containing protein 1